MEEMISSAKIDPNEDERESPSNEAQIRKLCRRHQEPSPPSVSENTETTDVSLSFSKTTTISSTNPT